MRKSAALTWANCSVFMVLKALKATNERNWNQKIKAQESEVNWLKIPNLTIKEDCKSKVMTIEPLQSYWKTKVRTILRWFNKETTSLQLMGSTSAVVLLKLTISAQTKTIKEPQGGTKEESTIKSTLVTPQLTSVKMTQAWKTRMKMRNPSSSNSWSPCSQGRKQFLKQSSLSQKYPLKRSARNLET